MEPFKTMEPKREATVYHASSILYFRVACVIRHAYVAATRACGSNATHHFSLHHPREQTITLVFVFLPVRLIQQPFSSQINHHNPHSFHRLILQNLGLSSKSASSAASRFFSSIKSRFHVVSRFSSSLQLSKWKKWTKWNKEKKEKKKKKKKKLWTKRTKWTKWKERKEKKEKKWKKWKMSKKWTKSEEGERWNQKRHQKVQKEEPQLPLSGSLPLSGTQKVTGDPLRGKMAAEGKNRARALTAER
ncbi:hypothetical protein LR48_Vigan10g143000 [Vigna angularis]|uniref:Uncharacterized protein n=1 Tax=Phaseolus angularis TaxID=3914 RepID=A0A0L9VKN8_PHAAN|nr:hypothetical protein LR48_Vigan10g143000 [Vigna angularis]